MQTPPGKKSRIFPSRLHLPRNGPAKRRPKSSGKRFTKASRESPKSSRTRPRSFTVDSRITKRPGKQKRRKSSFASRQKVFEGIQVSQRSFRRSRKRFERK